VGYRFGGEDAPPAAERGVAALRRPFSKAAIVIGLTAGVVTIGGGIALASPTGPSVHSGSSVSSHDHGNGGDDHGGGGHH
jgi:hypothetical protein